MADEGPDAPTIADTYFTERPRSASARSRLRFLFRGEMLEIEVDRGIFASTGLDRGTELLIANTEFPVAGDILDLGCGWGPIGIAAAKSSPAAHVVLTEVNRRAAYLARRNLERNRIENAEVRMGSLYRPIPSERFALIATNPPYHAGREFIEEILRGAPDHLAPEGRLILVGKGSQGIRFYQQQLDATWPGSVRVLARGSGYRVLEAALAPEKRTR